MSSPLGHPVAFGPSGTQYVLRLQEKGGKSREIAVRHDPEGYILEYVETAGIANEPKDGRSLGRHYDVRSN